LHEVHKIKTYCWFTREENLTTSGKFRENIGTRVYEDDNENYISAGLISFPDI